MQDRNGIITSYTLKIQNVATGNVQEISTSNTRITVTDLLPYTRYKYQIAAHTSIGQGPFTSLSAAIQTNQDGKRLPCIAFRV